MVKTIGEVVYTRAVLEQVYGGRMRELPAVIFTDSNNLHKSIYSTKLVNDPWLIPDGSIRKSRPFRQSSSDNQWE